MIEFLYKLTAKIKNSGLKIWTICYKINKLMINIIYPITQKFNKKYGLDEKSVVIISITTFPKRINSVWITISTLLNQKNMKPKKVILWLAEEQFPDHKLPYNLTKLIKRGLEIRYCEDLKPHKKYYYTMKEYPAYYIITVDDDIFYPENFVEMLMKENEKYPNTIICNWAHKITFNSIGEFNKYNLWEKSVNELSILTVPIGCCGILYPPNCLDEEVFNIKKLKKLALYTDDLWLKCMEVKKDILAININNNDIIFFNNLRSQFSGLWKDNVTGKNRNDEAWKNLMINYNEVEKKIKDKSE